MDSQEKTRQNAAPSTSNLYKRVSVPETSWPTPLETVLSHYLATSPENEKEDRQALAMYLQRINSLTPSTNVEIRGYKTLTTLPAGFNPQGNVDLSACTSLTSLPAGFNPQGTVYLVYCRSLTSLPDGFNPQGNVNLSRCDRLTSLPAGFNPPGNVDLSGCARLTSLPDGFNPQGNVDLSGCVRLKSLPAGFNPQRNVDLSGCDRLTSLSAGFNPQGPVCLAYCTSLTSLPDGFNPQGNVDLSGCERLRSLPAGFNPQGNVDLSGCERLRSLPDGFNPQGNVYLSHCTSLTSLPAGFNPQGDVDLSRCASLTSLPADFNPQGNVYLSGCIGLATIPESMFRMPHTARVHLNRTGLNARTVAEINRRQNTPGYNGPSFALSICNNTYRSEMEATAATFPEILAAIGYPHPDSLWAFVVTQTGPESLWNVLARFLSRILNETPRQNGEIPPELTRNLSQIFTHMESEFLRSPAIPDDGFITTILNDAETGIGTCIDKVKVGYVLMQLHTLAAVAQTPEEQQRYVTQLQTVERTLDFVSSINGYCIVYDTQENQFRAIHCAELNEDDETYHFTIQDTAFTDASMSVTLPITTARQLFVGAVNDQTNGRFQTIRIGDEVEDILFLTYRQIPNIHQFDLRFDCCRTLQDEAHIQAAIRFMNPPQPFR